MSEANQKTYQLDDIWKQRYLETEIRLKDYDQTKE
jgi:hypothetical protein